MTIELTETQRQAVLKGEAVRVAAPELGEDIVLVRAKRFEEIQEILDDEAEQAVFRAFALKQASQIAKDNPF